jgi:hypothetical protein
MTENFIRNVVDVLSLKQIGYHFVRHPVKRNHKAYFPVAQISTPTNFVM